MGRTTVLTGCTLVLPGTLVPRGMLVMAEGLIRYAGVVDEDRIPERAEILPAEGRTAIPGLIDTHVHGTYGDDVMNCGPEGIRRISRRFVRHATTAWMPSTISARHAELVAAVRDCVAAGTTVEGGASIVGIHVEGPYINPRRKGAQPEQGIRDPDFAEVAELLAAGEGRIRIVTLAPELPGGLELTADLANRGVVASVGHTDATYDQALAAFAAGATHATHLFNAMRPIHHRDPGVIAACLNEDAVLAEVIPDGVHLHPDTVRLALRAKGREGAVLITDAFSATGLAEGEHRLGPHVVHVQGDLCTLPDGTIAGSILTMEAGVRNAMKFAFVSLPDAVYMASLVPARLAGCAARKGSLEPGKDADVALLDDEFRCVATWIAGERVWAADC